MPAQNEPCICCSFLVVELILYVELNVETCSCWIVCGNTGTLLDSSWNEVFEESLLGSSLSFPLEIILFTELLFLSG